MKIDVRVTDAVQGNEVKINRNNINLIFASLLVRLLFIGHLPLPRLNVNGNQVK